MIGNLITDTETGEPLDHNGNKLSVSEYNPPEEIKKLFARVQQDYQIAWRLQHREFDEFDGMSLLDRANLDQQTFGAFVGMEFVPEHKQWRWKGRKNTARNKIIGILAHMISGMLYPYVYSSAQEGETEDLAQEHAKVMRILIENHLKKAQYETQFLFMVCSALVNPAVFVEVEYIEAMQRIKVRDGEKWKIEDVVDELLSGVNLNIVPIDQLLLADFYTSSIQKQPYIIRLERISWDEARSRFAGKCFIDGKDQFDYVRAGSTRIMMSGQENQTIYDIEWTEADQNYTQVITAKYRAEDLEVTFVGGVFIGNVEDVYNSNPFSHRRFAQIGEKWYTIPMYNVAKSGFEPIDPTGRFAYFKSAAFKEFWDDAAQNQMHRLAYDGTYLDVIKPIFFSGVSKIDGEVIIPGAAVAMPEGATVTPYSLSPNLMGALNMMNVETNDMSESTQDKIMSGITQKGVTAYATSKAEQNAKIFLGVFAILIADLVKQIGEIVIDCTIAHTTVGELDESTPESLKMKFKDVTYRSKESGKDIVSKIQFDSELMGDSLTNEKADEIGWDMFMKAQASGGKEKLYKVNPYKFARRAFGLTVDPEMITSRAMGTDQLRKERAFTILTDPRVAPYINQEAVVDKYVLEEFSDGNPDQFKKTPEQMQMPIGDISQPQPMGGSNPTLPVLNQ